jgi:hypothetical protein
VEFRDNNFWQNFEMLDGTEAEAEEKRRPTESLAQEVQTRVIEAFEVRLYCRVGTKIFVENAVKLKFFIPKINIFMLSVK